MHRIVVPRGYPLPRGPRATFGPSLQAELAPEGRTSPYQGVVYGTRLGYMNQDPGHAPDLLKRTGVVEHLLGSVPSSRTLLARGPARTLVRIVGRLLTLSPIPI